MDSLVGQSSVKKDMVTSHQSSVTSHQSPVTSFHTKKRVLAKVGPGYLLRPVPTILNTHVDPKSKRYHCLSKEHHELGTRCWKA